MMLKIYIPDETISRRSYTEYAKHFDITSAEDAARILLCRFNTKLDVDFLEKFCSLKAIVTLTTGVDHIDLDYCSQHGISVLSLKNNWVELQNIKSSAEHALLLSLFAARGCYDIFQESLFNLSNNFNPELFPDEISEQTFGIIGYGRIGRYLSSVLALISKEVFVYDPYISDSPLNERITVVGSIEALVKVDNLILSCTYNEETTALIDCTFLNLLPPGKSFNIVNISRGPIVHAKDFCDSASSNPKLRYFLDVGDSYTLKDQQHLEFFQKQTGQILCTPHIAGQAASAIHKADMIGLGVLLDWLNGEDNS